MSRDTLFNYGAMRPLERPEVVERGCPSRELVSALQELPRDTFYEGVFKIF